MSIINTQSLEQPKAQEEAVLIAQQVESLNNTVKAMLLNILRSTYEGGKDEINARLAYFSEADFEKLKTLSAGLQQIINSAEEGAAAPHAAIVEEGEAKRV